MQVEESCILVDLHLRPYCSSAGEHVGAVWISVLASAIFWPKIELGSGARWSQMGVWTAE